MYGGYFPHRPAEARRLSGAVAATLTCPRTYVEGERVASLPRAGHPTFPKPNASSFKAAGQRGLWPDSRTAAARHVTAAVPATRSADTEATSLDQKEMAPPCMWHHRAPGGHRRPYEKLKDSLVNARDREGRLRVRCVWRVETPPPASWCTGPGAFLVARTPPHGRESLRDPGEHLRGQVTARGTDSCHRHTVAPTECLREVVSNSIYNSRFHWKTTFTF